MRDSDGNRLHMKALWQVGQFRDVQFCHRPKGWPLRHWILCGWGFGWEISSAADRVKYPGNDNLIWLRLGPWDFNFYRRAQ